MSHTHGSGCGCSRDETDAMGVTTLFGSVDVDKAWCLNELKQGMAKMCLKAHHERFDGNALKSDEDDGELILHVPFTCEVKVRGFCVMGKPGLVPDKVKIWINRDDITFSNCKRTKCSQEVNLACDEKGEYFYPLKAHIFQNVANITMFFPQHSGSDQTVIEYIGFKGISTNLTRQAVTAVYEARALPEDHKTPNDTKMSHDVK